MTTTEMQPEERDAELDRLRKENAALRKRDGVMCDAIRELSQAKIDADADARTNARRLRQKWIDSEDRCVAVAGRAVLRKQKLRKMKQVVRDLRDDVDRAAYQARVQGFASRSRGADVGELTELLCVLSCFRPDVFADFADDPANQRFDELLRELSLVCRDATCANK